MKMKTQDIAKTWAALLLLILATACGRETKVYPGLDATGSNAEPPVTGLSLLEGFHDQSVNFGFADIALDGATATSMALRLRTLPMVNPPGGFNGAGPGNRALVGLSQYDSQPLASIQSVSFDVKTFAGTEKISILLLADLNCDGSTPRVIVAKGADIETFGSTTIVENAYTRYDAKFNDAVWTVSGPSLKDPDDISITLIPSEGGVETADLELFLQKYPSACLRNGFSHDDQLPSGFPTAGVLFALGNDSTTDAHGVFLNRLSVGSDVFSELE